MTVFVVDTKKASYLFHDRGAADAFARAERQWWADHCQGIGPVPIHPRLWDAAIDQFIVSPADGSGVNWQDEPLPLEAGPGQAGCRRIDRRLHQWWEARMAWWDAITDDAASGVAA